MTLKGLLGLAHVTPNELLGDAEVTSVEIDSRLCKPGSLFICMPGMTRESEGFIADAARSGASAVLAHSRAGIAMAEDLGIAAARIGDFTDSIWRICDVFFNHPTRRMKVVGVTGTNGKTTTAWIIRDLLSLMAVDAAYLGTLGYQSNGEQIALENTTPFAVQLYNLIDSARAKGVEAISMEASSHALAQRRLDGIEFDAAVFTNLTQDHLDYHGTMGEYEAAKHRLFTELPLQTQKRFVAAFNMDDPVGARWAAEQRGAVIRYGIEATDVDLRGVPVQVRVDGIRMRFECGGSHEATLKLGGSYNVENALSAVAAMLGLGYALEEVVPLLSKVRPVPGRFEAIPNDRGIGVMVDYAHTPDALEKLLDSVRKLEPRRVITVFGCGGDRDPIKRPKMARAASERSDLTVLTSDNPRTEDPQKIVDQAAVGLIPGSDHVVILDRPEAVQYAVTHAQQGDVVVIAGKGHEDYQIIGRTKHHMDDRELVQAALRSMD